MYICYIFHMLILSDISKTVTFHYQVPIKCLSLEECFAAAEKGTLYLKDGFQLPNLQMEKMEITMFTQMSDADVEGILAYACQSQIITELVYVSKAKFSN